MVMTVPAFAVPPRDTATHASVEQLSIQWDTLEHADIEPCVEALTYPGQAA